MPETDRLRSLRVVDVQVGGDVHRVILSGVQPAEGRGVRQWMEHIEHRADGLRRLLIYEPYGGEHMCANLIVPAGAPGAAYGFVIMEVMGYPFYSGSNTIATVGALLDSGMVALEDGDQTIHLETPGGPISVVAHNAGGRCRGVTTHGDAAFVLARDRQVHVEALDTRVTYDLVWSGGWYVLVDAARLGHTVRRESVPAMIDTADAIIRAVQTGFAETHPVLGDCGLPRFLHFMGPLEDSGDGGLRSPSATYGHPGVIWRCPTGTGTSARLAWMAARGRADVGTTLETVSPWGNAFAGRLTRHVGVGPCPAVETEITARPYVLARSEVVVDLDDPAVRDYALEDILAG